MKRFILILLAVLAAFGAVATAVSANQKPQATQAPTGEVGAPISADASEFAPATAEPIVIRTLDYDAIAALRPADETVFSLGDESISWKEYCEWLGMNGRQIEDYFSQMASYYGMAADWEGSVGDGTGRNFAKYVVEETNANLVNILSYLSFAADRQVTLSDEQQAQLTDEGLAKGLLGENATAEELIKQLESESFSIDTYRRICKTNLLLDKYYDDTYGPEGEKVSDEDAVAWLEGQKYVSAGHILFMTIDPNTGDKLDEAVIAEKRVKAESVAEELRAIEDTAEREKRFLELKQELCEDGGKRTYPEGYTYTPGTMVTEFESAVNALEPFEVSDPVESHYGYHVIMRLPLRPDSLLYSAQGTPSTARREAAVEGMNRLLDEYIEAHPVVIAEGIEDLDVTKYIK